MSIHNEAKSGEVAERVLLPGDPLRAKFIAENFLEDITLYNKVRNALGYTGYYKGIKISVQSTGMGIPSMSIYTNELLEDYGVKKLIRVGTCGSFHPKVELNDLITAMSACTDSNVNKIRFKNLDYAPHSDFQLLKSAVEKSEKLGFKTHCGSVLTSDHFYIDFNEEEYYKMWSNYGVLAIEMETTALYTLAAKYNAQALSILHVTDDLANKTHLSSEQRQTGLHKLIELGLETIIS